MKKALLTGKTGFVGSNIYKILCEDYIIFAPSRQELNLLDEVDVRNYIQKNSIEVVFHCANPNPAKNIIDQNVNMAEGSLRMFTNILSCNNLYEKMIYLGSGAMYDKTLEICRVTEKECFRSIPKDSYGFAKYIENKISRKEPNVVNLCLFACYGPADHESKFITHCIRCCMENKPITIRQDCKFDYLHVYDLGRYLSAMGYIDLKDNLYNVSGNEHMYLSQIAEEVKKAMNSDSEITIVNPGLNHEYTADGNKLDSEIGIKRTINMMDGIRMQIEWEKKK